MIHKCEVCILYCCGNKWFVETPTTAQNATALVSSPTEIRCDNLKCTHVEGMHSKSEAMALQQKMIGGEQ